MCNHFLDAVTKMFSNLKSSTPARTTCQSKINVCIARIRQPFAGFALGLLLLLGWQAAQAQVAAGTMLSVRAYAEYLPIDQIQARRAYSNDVLATVSAVESLTLTGDVQVFRPPASQISLPFLLSNTGNVAADFALAINNNGGGCASDDFDLSNLQVVVDANGDGVAGANEPALALSDKLMLSAGDSRGLLITAGTPNRMGGVACVALTATSALQNVSATVTSTVVLGSGAALQSALSASFNGALIPSVSMVTYTLRLQNNGTQAATPSATVNHGTHTIQVNGTPTPMVLIRDPVPTGSQYIAGSLHTALAGAVKLYRLPSDPPFSYRTLEDASAVEVAIGLMTTMPRDASLSMSFSTRLTALTTSTPNNLMNQAFVHYADALGDTQSSSNAVVLPIAHDRLGVALAASAGVAQINTAGQADGTALVRFSTKVRNFGTSPLFNVQVRNVLDDAGGGSRLGNWTALAVPGNGQYAIVANSLRIRDQRGSGWVAAVNSAYSGRAGTETLLAPGAYLPAGGEFNIEFDARINFVGRGTLYDSATAYASRLPGEAADVTDLSIDGTNPDPQSSDNPQLQSSLTAILPPPALTVSKTASVPRRLGMGVYEIDYRVLVSNSGTVAAPHVRVIDNLDCAVRQSTHGTVAHWQLVAAPVASHGLLGISSSYTGSAPCVAISDGSSGLPLQASVSLTDGNNALAPGKSEAITFSVRITLAQLGGRAQIINQAWAGSFGDAGAILGAGDVLSVGNSNTDSLLIDPQGVVYDSVTRSPIAGAAVTVRRMSCQASAASAITADQIFDGNSGLYRYLPDGSVSMLTGSDGVYQFFWKSPPVADICTYTVAVTPPVGSRYVTPSTVIPPQPEIFSTCGLVVASGAVPQGGEPTTYYPSFLSGINTSTGTICEVIHNNLPLDPIGARVSLLIKKEGSRREAEIGDFIDYTLTASNRSGIPLPGISYADTLPPGFAYVKGSTRFNGQRLDDPIGGSGPQLLFAYPDYILPTDASASLQYRVRIGVGAPTNGVATNRARAISNDIRSNEATWNTQVTGGPFADDAYAIGKVHLDCNGNGLQDGGDDLGIPGVRLIMENGTSVVTDGEGRWSLYGLKPLTHVIKLDASTLPAGAQLAVLDNRNAGAPDSRFLDVKKGELAKANFTVSNCSLASVRDEVQARRTAAAAQATSHLDAAVKARLQFANVGSSVGDIRALPATGSVSGTGIASGAVIARPLIDLPDSLAQTGVSAGTAPLAPLTQAPSGLVTWPINPRAGGADMLGNLPAPSRVDLESLVPTLDAAPGFIELKDGDTVPSRTLNVRVKGPIETQLQLSANGQAVNLQRVGKKSSLGSQGVSAWEYIGVELRAGANLLELDVVDAMGNVRGKSSITVIAPDKLGAIRFELPGNLRADPAKPLEVTVRLTDVEGVPVTARTQLSLEADRGRWLVADLDPGDGPIQTFVEGGVGRFLFEPPSTPGAARLRATSNLIARQQTLEFLPEQRPMIGIGIIEGTIDLSNRGSLTLGTAPAGSAFETELSGLSHQTDDLRLGARSAFYFKGTVKGDYLLTTAFDSDKTTRDRLFRDIRPDEYYPVYGDESSQAFDAQSSRKLYVRVDKGRSYLLYGDFTTASSPEVRQLSQVSRSLTGLKHELKTDNLQVSSFASDDSSSQQIEEIRATGLSFYFLSGSGEILANSEKVELIVRSRTQAQVVLTTRALTRFADYVLEPQTRRLILVNPVPSVDPDFNPQSVRVTYEVSGGGERFLVGGIDAQVKVSDTIQLGVVDMSDANPENAHSLSAVTALTRIGTATLVAAEIVQTQADLQGQGNAARVEIQHAQGDLKAQAQVQRTDNNFYNPSASLSAGRTEATARAEYQLDANTRLRSELLYSQYETLNSPAYESASVSVALQKKLNDYLVGEIGLRHGNDSGTSAGTFDYGQIIGSATPVTAAGSSGNGISSSTARGRLTLRPPALPRAEMFGEYEQRLDGSNDHLLAIGGAYALTDQTRLYGRHEFDGGLYDPTSSQQRITTVFGIDSAYMEGGRIYNEYRLATQGGQDATGVRNTFRLNEFWRLSTGFEHTSDFRDGTNSQGSSNAFNLGADYARGSWRGSSAFETRHASSADSHLLSLGAAYKLSADWTALGRSTVTLTDGVSSGRHVLSRQQLGLAWRPASTDRINGLLRLEERYETIGANSSGASTYSLYGGAGNALPGSYRSQVFTGLANITPERGTQLSARYAVKFSSEDAAELRSSYWAQLAHLRYTRDLSPHWDLGAQAGVLWGSGGAQQRTMGLEAGYQVVKNLWLSFGYNFVGLQDADLAGANYTSQGAYLRLRFKFDETTLGMGVVRPGQSQNAGVQP